MALGQVLNPLNPLNLKKVGGKFHTGKFQIFYHWAKCISSGCWLVSCHVV